MFGPLGFWTMAPLCYAAKFDPVLSLDQILPSGNLGGRFIKIAEISADGRKNQILMTLPTAAQFRQHLVSMIQAVRWVVILLGQYLLQYLITY